MLPKLSSGVTACYRDVLDLLQSRSRERKKSVRLSALFDGVIPDTTRNKINNARPLFKEIFLVAEISNWSYEEKTPTRPKQVDPLVIGFDGISYRLIDAFDLTTLEQIVKDRVDGRKGS